MNFLKKLSGGALLLLLVGGLLAFGLSFAGLVDWKDSYNAVASKFETDPNKKTEPEKKSEEPDKKGTDKTPVAPNETTNYVEALHKQVKSLHDAKTNGFFVEGNELEIPIQHVPERTPSYDEIAEAVAEGLDLEVTKIVAVGIVLTGDGKSLEGGIVYFRARKDGQDLPPGKRGYATFKFSDEDPKVAQAYAKAVYDSINAAS